MPGRHCCASAARRRHSPARLAQNSGRRVRSDFAGSAEGLKQEILMRTTSRCADFRPRNVDGEVSEFQALAAQTLIAHRGRGDALAAGLVAADFACARHAQDEDGEYGGQSRPAACLSLP